MGFVFFVCEMTLSCLWDKMERIRAEKTENKMFYVLALSGFGCAEAEVQRSLWVECIPEFLQN